MVDNVTDRITLPQGLVLRTGCVALSPHIDDIAFSLGAMLLDSRFSTMIVVNIFSISNCTVDDSDNDVARVTEMLKREDSAFYSALGVHIERLYLDRHDAPLRLSICDKDVFSISQRESDDKEVECLTAFLKELMQSNTLLIGPLGLGRHVDHILVRRAACLMMRSGCAIAFYEDLPYAGGMLLSEIELVVDAMRMCLGTNLEPCLIQSSSNASRKVEAISAYHSQIDRSTIERIVKHGERLSNRGIAERLWCNCKALKLIESTL